MAPRIGCKRRACAAVGSVLLATTWLVTAASADEKPDGAAQRGMSYDSLKTLPDFSGWWYLVVDANDGFGGLLKAAAPFVAKLKPEAAQRFKAFAEKFGGTSLPDTADVGLKPQYCTPPRFAGSNGGFAEDLEFLFTPGRITLATEGGLVRRIYLNRPLPTDVEETYTATSVGHWEGATLVVETTGIDHDTNFLGPLQIGRNVHTVERISLKDKDTLRIVSILTAPDVLTEPVETTALFARDHGHVYHESTSCVETDRSIDPTTGRQRFDLTPPPDLPPPPG